MRRSVGALALSVATLGSVTGCAAGAGRPTADTRDASAITSQVHRVLVAGVDTLGHAVRMLDSAVAAAERSGGAISAGDIQLRFADARRAYKAVEFLVTYFEPTTARLINGPALPRVDDDEGPEGVHPPEGFQVLEALFFPALQPDDCNVALQEVRNLEELVTRLRTAIARLPLTDSHVWDAAKLAVARLSSLGIAGFDSPIARHSLSEGRAAIGGILAALRPYAPRTEAPRWARLDAAFHAADSLLAAGADFDSFDRLGFIVEGANPLARAIVETRTALRVGLPSERRAFRLEAATLFDRDAFDVMAFAAPHTPTPTAARAVLGRALFFDRRLSGDGTRSCATCHDPARAFTDGNARAIDLAGRPSLRNSPTIINAGLQVGSFYDLRTAFLEDQVTDVVGNPDEMHGNLDVTVERLRRDSLVARDFEGAYRGMPGQTITADRVRDAIAAYVRSLVALDSPVDRALRGEVHALDAEERRGFNLFMGKAACGTCHFAPLFNGTVPPMYAESEVEVLGVPARSAARRHALDPDSGRFHVTRAAPHLHAFKTPTVRNVTLTAPYMHNGAYRTLEEVVDFYNGGGGAGLGIVLPNQTLPVDSLHLTAAERTALVRFMRALTDTVGTSARPAAR